MSGVFASIDINCSMNELQILNATLNDLEEIIELLTDDMLGKTREKTDKSIYISGLTDILEDKNNHFFIAKIGLEIVGCFQLTIIPSLSRGASKRGQIESVRVNTAHRGQDIGTNMMHWAIEYCRNNGCNLIQLTTDKQRNQAHNFYKKLGFIGSHIGMKLILLEN